MFNLAPLIAGGSRFKVEIRFGNPEAWEAAASMDKTFDAQYSKLFKDIVFECHRYLIRVTPMITGRLRGGWTSFLNKYNKDYSAAFIDVSLIDASRVQTDASAVADGMSVSSYEETPLGVTVINKVHYGGFVEFGTSKMQGRNFTLRAMYKSELIFENAVNNWWSNADYDLQIEPSTVEETTA